MSTAPTVRPHGVGVRGATLSRGSLLFDGPFGRLFRALPAGDFGADDATTVGNLLALERSMVSEVDPKDPKKAPDNEESGTPAAYTYLGQFIDHDLTFDPSSSLQKQNDPDALVDYRTPRFDLDNIYGRGPDDQPYLYADGLRFNLGETPLTGAERNPNATDLPRARNGRAIIGDPRNDENVIVSQLQGLFLRFHNAMAERGSTFEDVQRMVRWHYQWVVLNDFLPRIVSSPVLNDVLPHLDAGSDPVIDPPRLAFYKPKKDAFIPLEFSAAAYRFGHSMVRPGYLLNPGTGALSILGKEAGKALTGFRRFPSDWAIDWRGFVDLEPMETGDPDHEDAPANSRRMMLAYRIDTSLVAPLGSLPASILPTGVEGKPVSLAGRNLLRGWRMRLPSGQAVARAMGVAPMADGDIRIGKFTDPPDDHLVTINEIAGGAFKGNCPLWAYILAETRTSAEPVTVVTLQGPVVIQTPRLGPVGGRIVAETIIGIMLADSSSYLAQDPLWTPWRDLPDGALPPGVRVGDPRDAFLLRNIVRAAL